MGWYIAVGVFILLVYQTGQSQAAKSLYEVETQLLKDVLSDYDTKVLPLVNASIPVKVTFGLHLQTINDVDETKGLLHIGAWLNYEWNDPRLKWNKSHYGGVGSVRFPATDLWIPDIMPYNGADPAGFISKEEATRIVVYPSGFCSWVPVVNIQTSCSMDLTNFPFDTQVCMLRFGSWTHIGETIDIDTHWNVVDVSSYDEHAEWDLTNTSAKRNAKKYPCCPEPLVDITFELTLTRKASCFTYLYVGPYALLALAIPFIFLLSSSGPHRCIFGGVIIVAMVILIGNLEWNVSGHGGNTPKLSIFYIGSFVCAVLVMLLANLVMFIAGKAGGKSAPPEFIMSILNRLPSQIFCCLEGEGAGDRKILGAESVEAQQPEWLKIAGLLDCIFFIVSLVTIVLMAMITLIH